MQVPEVTGVHWPATSLYPRLQGQVPVRPVAKKLRKVPGVQARHPVAEPEQPKQVGEQATQAFVVGL